MQFPHYVLSFPKGSGWLLILMFDTHQAVKELTEAGFVEAQAEAVVATVSRSMSENVATKADIAEVKADIAIVKADIAVVKADIASLRVETKADIASLRVETKADIASLRTEMAALEMRIIVKMTGVVLAIVTLGVAFLKLFP